MHKFTLIENALDSLEHAIAALTAKPKLETGDYKRVIVDLSHVAELLLKERLRQIHPAFVFVNVDKYPSKEAHTVGAEQALDRLKKLGEIEFTDNDISALKTMRDKRNEVTHFEFVINEDEAKIVIGNMLVFIFRFSNDELDLDWAQRRLDDPNWIKLKEYASFFKAQLAHIKEIIEGSGIPTTDCPMCYNETFDLEAEVCLLCGCKEDVLECCNKRCKAPYLESQQEYQVSELCPKCEWEDAYASANHEQY